MPFIHDPKINSETEAVWFDNGYFHFSESENQQLFVCVRK